jgi:L-lactate dehydrogenase (cytochrome)
MPVITEIEDLRRIYKRRVPKMFYDYAESGSWTSRPSARTPRISTRSACASASRWTWTGGRPPRRWWDRTTPCPWPWRPWASAACNRRMARSRPRARRRSSACPSRCRPCRSVRSRTWRANTTKPFWFQVYTLKDDDFMKRLFARAKDAKCSALVITVDLQIMGQRHRDLKNGLSAPPKLTLASMANLATKIPWGLEMLQTKRRFFGNIVGPCRGRVRSRLAGLMDGGGVRPLAQLGADQGIPQLVGRTGDPEGRPRRGRREDGRQCRRRRDRGVEPWRPAA